MGVVAKGKFYEAIKFFFSPSSVIALHGWLVIGDDILLRICAVRTKPLNPKRQRERFKCA